MLRNYWVIKSNFCTINNRVELAFEEIFKVFDLKAKWEREIVQEIIMIEIFY